MSLLAPDRCLIPLCHKVNGSVLHRDSIVLGPTVTYSRCAVEVGMPSLRSRRLDGVIVGTVATLFEAKSPR